VRSHMPKFMPWFQSTGAFAITSPSAWPLVAMSPLVGHGPSFMVPRSGANIDT
jgi:hypothetical protein